jgi:hypothetical protein
MWQQHFTFPLQHSMEQALEALTHEIRKTSNKKYLFITT